MDEPLSACLLPPDGRSAVNCRPGELSPFNCRAIKCRPMKCHLTPGRIPLFLGDGLITDAYEL